ncbi:hypothetical protein [Mycolicibacterium sp. 120270]|uniref:hypothetical protein n=1 Tax=Mycolicibacterium sp. 120270 TaxID=3090600 RepID=UPI00299D7E83|nr:hypothetical protein [Mycolicibacterium sp. 120270]MDX1883257.1 hypothetical protein [Mycolicibacterium sp. 120270]
MTAHSAGEHDLVFSIDPVASGSARGAAVHNPVIPLVLDAVPSQLDDIAAAEASPPTQNWTQSVFGGDGIVTSIGSGIGGAVSAVAAVIALRRTRPTDVSSSTNPDPKDDPDSTDLKQPISRSFSRVSPKTARRRPRSRP